MKYTKSEERIIKRFEKKFSYIDSGLVIFNGDAGNIKDFLIKEVRRNRRSAARLGLVPKDLG